jgi:hypothetical protein
MQALLSMMEKMALLGLTDNFVNLASYFPQLNPMPNCQDKSKFTGYFG